MSRRLVGQFDASTGEVLEGGQLAVVFPKRRNGFHDGWVAVAQNPLIEVVKLNLGDQANRVLLCVVATLGFENFMSVSQADIGKMLGMKPPHVSAAFKKLVDHGILLAGPKAGRVNTYRLNPDFGWKGSAKNHHAALTERMKARGFSVVEGGGSSSRADSDQSAVSDPYTGDLFGGMPEQSS